jgi:anti-anti-sigma regulatory factor
MAVRTETVVAPSALAVDLELSHGRHGAAARIEFHDAADGTIAIVRVRGWIDAVALGRLQEILDDLGRRGVARVALDCAQLRHIDYRLVAALIAALSSLESRALGYGWCGLSPHLRDLFRLSGCDPGLHEFVSTESWIRTGHPEIDPSREWAS